VTQVNEAEAASTNNLQLEIPSGGGAAGLGAFLDEVFVENAYGRQVAGQGVEAEVEDGHAVAQRLRAGFDGLPAREPQWLAADQLFVEAELSTCVVADDVAGNEVRGELVVHVGLVRHRAAVLQA
jgi:hypothetical protein